MSLEKNTINSRQEFWDLMDKLWISYWVSLPAYYPCVVVTDNSCESRVEPIFVYIKDFNAIL
jgi:hypothetical protein